MTEDEHKELEELMAMEELLNETTDPSEAEALAKKLKPYLAGIGEDEPEPEEPILKAFDEPEEPRPVLPRDKRKRGVESKSVESRLLYQAVVTDGLETGATPAARVQYAVAMMDSINPMNAIEGMMATQMIALHNMAMDCANRASRSNQTFEGRDMNMRHAARLMNAFTHAVEALDKHRGKGQTITVKHQQVTVESGGQAVIGNVSHGGGENKKGE